MTALMKVRELPVGAPIEYRKVGDKTWVAPWRGRVVDVMVRPRCAAVVRLEPLSPAELRATAGSNFEAQAYLDGDVEVTILDLPGSALAPTPRVPVARPLVPVRKLDDGTVVAECRHCDWSMTSPVRAAVTPYADWHRANHRAGALAVTR